MTMNNKDTEAPETVCAHCAVPIFRITGDSQSWAHLGTGQARCSILATPRVDPPAAPAGHEHRWVGRREYGDTSSGYMCADCGVDLDDTPDVAPPAPDERDMALEDRLWEALKQHACKVPDEAKLIVFLSEKKFREAVGPVLTTLRQQVEGEVWERAIYIAKAEAFERRMAFNVYDALKAARDGREGKESNASK